MLYKLTGDGLDSFEGCSCSVETTLASFGDETGSLQLGERLLWICQNLGQIDNVFTHFDGRILLSIGDRFTEFAGGVFGSTTHNVAITVLVNIAESIYVPNMYTNYIFPPWSELTASEKTDLIDAEKNIRSEHDQEDFIRLITRLRTERLMFIGKSQTAGAKTDSHPLGHPKIILPTDSDVSEVRTFAEWQTLLDWSPSTWLRRRKDFAIAFADVPGEKSCGIREPELSLWMRSAANKKGFSFEDT